MARIVIQTDDFHTVLDERDVARRDLDDEGRRTALLARLDRAIHVSERRGRGAVRRVACIVPVTDYRELRG